MVSTGNLYLSTGSLETPATNVGRPSDEVLWNMWVEYSFRWSWSLLSSKIDSCTAHGNKRSGAFVWYMFWWVCRDRYRPLVKPVLPLTGLPRVFWRWAQHRDLTVGVVLTRLSESFDLCVFVLSHDPLYCSRVGCSSWGRVVVPQQQVTRLHVEVSLSKTLQPHCSLITKTGSNSEKNFPTGINKSVNFFLSFLSVCSSSLSPQGEQQRSPFRASLLICWAMQEVRTW